MRSIAISLVFTAAFLSSCSDQKPASNAPATTAAATPAPSDSIEFPLADMSEWKPIENGVCGPCSVKEGVLKLGSGDGVTGVVYTGKAELPLVNYELSWEARKTDGIDFFAAATFQVRKKEDCGTFINGGWGGGVTGISNLDSLSANENNTTTTVDYETNRWFKFRIQVTPEMLIAYVDERKVVNCNITEKKVSLRGGDIEHCAPLGFASYQSKGEIKNIRIRKLKPGEVPLDPDAY
jgi:hypothetical protein